MSVSNIVTAAFGCGKFAKTRELYQYDYGQRLQFAGLTLPDSYVVDFSHHQAQGDSKPQVGGADGVTIPDAYLTSGEDIYAFVFLHAGEDDGETVYRVHIPVKARPRRTEETPTPVQQSAIDEAIAALNAGVERAETAAESAEDAVQNIQQTVDAALQEAKDSGEFDGPQGDPGDDGVSPTVAVTDITGGHRVTITDAGGAHSFDVLDGEDGQGAVQDVQVNGTSIVNAQGVANVTPAKLDFTEQVSGTTPVINALPGIRYVCGEVATLDITLPESGIVDVVFESGSTPTVLSGLDNVRWTGGFDPDNLDANTTYEINIADGLGVAGSWT